MTKATNTTSLVRRVPWRRIAMLLVLIYAVVGVLLVVFQTALVFPATQLYADADATVAPDGVDVVSLPSGTPLWVQGEHDRIVLIVHGNAEWVRSMHTGYQAPLDALAFSFAAVEFRDVAGTPGPLTEDGLVDDATAAIDALIARGWPAERIVVHGRSIGGGIASQAATRRPVAGLVLESTFDSLSAVVASTFPAMLYPGALLRTPLRSDRALQDADLPVFQVHDIYDSVVGIERARALRVHLSDATVTETAGYRHGTPIVLTDARAHLEWQEWLNETVPFTGPEPREGRPGIHGLP